METFYAVFWIFSYVYAFQQLLVEMFFFAMMIYLAGWAAIAHTLEEKLAGTQRLSQNATRCNKETIQEINF